MDINRLRYFRAVVETRSIRRAAEILRMSPGALSKSIKILEDEFGVSFVTQEGRGIAITDDGMKLYSLAGRTLDEYAGLLSAFSDRKTPNMLRVATFEIFSTYMMSRLLLTRLRGVPILSLERTPGQIEEAIIQRHADVGVTYLPYPSNGLEHRKICDIQFGAFTCRGAFADTKIDQIPFAVPISSLAQTPLDIDSLDCWPRAAGSRLTLYRFELLETALQTAANGIAAIYCPTFVIALHNERVIPKLRLAPLPIKMANLTQTGFLVFRTGNKDTVLRTLTLGIREICSREPHMS